ncbi:MAG: cyclic pyranopterin monophosphate synthase MoaC [Gemmatimonadetes bacterium]|nr:cyclic pyranopterin monophosphate synthase MoaC [Gemmatimonadota bacterium]
MTRDKESDGKRLTHLGPDGTPTMVSVEEKATTRREAVAEGAIRCSPEAYQLLETADNPKGDVLQVARLAGIMAGKRAGELIPLCHVIPQATVKVVAESDPELPGVRIRATASVASQTGVEIEALTAVSVALLTVYDMLKAVDRGMEILGIRLVSKSGGRSGSWTADGKAGAGEP